MKAKRKVKKALRKNTLKTIKSIFETAGNDLDSATINDLLIPFRNNEPALYSLKASLIKSGKSKRLINDIFPI